MPLPSQTFSKIIPDLIGYINTKIIPNGTQFIDGDALNNVLNSLANFIIKYQVNGELAQVDTGGGNTIASKPIIYFTGAPLSLTLPDNVQNEYYLINATSNDISFSSGFSYFDVYNTPKSVLAKRNVTHIAKTSSGVWVQLNNIVSGSGGGGSLPPQSGNAGSVLVTDGSSEMWGAVHLSLKGSDFANATDYQNSYLQNFKFSIFVSEMNRYIYQDMSEWSYLPGGGFKMLIPGFDSTVPDFGNWHFELILKPF